MTTVVKSPKKWPQVNTLNGFRSTGQIQIPTINKSSQSKPSYILPNKFVKQDRSSVVKSFLNQFSIARPKVKQTLNIEVPNEQLIIGPYIEQSSIVSKFTHLSPNSPLPITIMKKIKWIILPNYFTVKLNFEQMEQEYGIEYTKDMIYSILNDDFGTFWFKVQSVDKDAKNYLKQSRNLKT